MDMLRAMRVFVNVVDEGSFANAARALKMTPAVITRTVAQLEAHLQARLLHRTTRRLSVTDVGAAYLDRVRRILAAVEDAEQRTRSDASDEAGVLRIAAPPTLLSHQLVRLLPEFRERHPRVALHIEPTQAPDVLDDNADVTLLVAPEDSLDGEFVARRLARSELLLCAAPSYLDQRGRPRHPSELAQHELLVSSVTPGLRPWRFEPADDAGRDSIVVRGRRGGAIDTMHHETLYEAAMAGMGIVNTLSFVAGQAVQRGQLERVLGDWRLGAYELHAGMPSRKHQTARSRLFIDFLVEKFGGQAHDPWLQAMAEARDDTEMTAA
ncbi:LysR family transcriptional regulator [Aquincola sp. MAHUQ-54]|uniref:LysR family transcriptional regulator n=1 Tax=Aquincola agrisoli TaxID=3119538 RepID=A0AAW9QEC8_9BURK